MYAALLQVHFPFPAFGQEVLSEGFAEGTVMFPSKDRIKLYEPLLLPVEGFPFNLLQLSSGWKASHALCSF